MGTIRFVLRTDKPTSDGHSPIELIYQLSGKRKYYRTKERLREQNWNANDQKAIYLDKREAKKTLPTVAFDKLPSYKEIEELNDRLASFRTEINDIEKAFEANKVLYSVEMIIDRIKENRAPLTKKEAPTGQVFDFIDQYIKDNTATTEPGSLSVYKSLKNHLQNYEADKKKRVTFESIDYAFFKNFQNYLFTVTTKRNPNGLGNITIAKQLSTLKTFLNYAKRHGFTVSDKYREFEIKKQKLEVIALTQDEFETLFNLDLSGNKSLSQVRDVFCFSVATGFRYAELAQLKREHIKGDTIRLTVKKTKQPLTVPLTPYSHAILNKYAGNLKPLPVISNQKMNEYLKDLCKLAEISDPVQIVRFRGNKKDETTYPKYELISCHTGRKSFATLSLEKGMSAEEVMKIGGWESYESFKRYVNVTEKRSKVVMRNAWGELPKPVLKAV